MKEWNGQPILCVLSRRCQDRGCFSLELQFESVQRMGSDSQWSLPGPRAKARCRGYRAVLDQLTFPCYTSSIVQDLRIEGNVSSKLLFALMDEWFPVMMMLKFPYDFLLLFWQRSTTAMDKAEDCLSSIRLSAWAFALIQLLWTVKRSLCILSKYFSIVAKYDVGIIFCR